MNTSEFFNAELSQRQREIQKFFSNRDAVKQARAKQTSDKNDALVRRKEERVAEKLAKKESKENKVIAIKLLKLLPHLKEVKDISIFEPYLKLNLPFSNFSDERIQQILQNIRSIFELQKRKKEQRERNLAALKKGFLFGVDLLVAIGFGTSLVAASKVGDEVNHELLHFPEKNPPLIVDEQSSQEPQSANDQTATFPLQPEVADLAPESEIETRERKNTSVSGFENTTSPLILATEYDLNAYVLDTLGIVAKDNFILRTKTDAQTSPPTRLDPRDFGDVEEAVTLLEKYKLEPVAPNIVVDYDEDFGRVKTKSFESIKRFDDEPLATYLARMGVMNQVLIDLCERIEKGEITGITFFGKNADGGLNEFQKNIYFLQQLGLVKVFIDFESPNVDRIAGDPNPIDLAAEGRKLTALLAEHNLQDLEIQTLDESQLPQAVKEYLVALRTQAANLGRMLSTVTIKDEVGNSQEISLDGIYVLGPVLDLINPQTNDPTAIRNISPGAVEAYLIAKVAILGYAEAGIISIPKHFPGYPPDVDGHVGGTVRMSNYDFPLSEGQFLVWDRLLRENVITEGVMLTHIVADALEEGGDFPDLIRQATTSDLPASFNPFWIDYFNQYGVVVYADGSGMDSARDIANGDKPVLGVLMGNELRLNYLLYAIAGAVMLTDPNSGDTSANTIAEFQMSLVTQIQVLPPPPADYEVGQPRRREEVIEKLIELNLNGSLFVNQSGSIDVPNLLRDGALSLEDFAEILWMSK